MTDDEFDDLTTLSNNSQIQISDSTQVQRTDSRYHSRPVDRAEQQKSSEKSTSRQWKMSALSSSNLKGSTRLRSLTGNGSDADGEYDDADFEEDDDDMEMMSAFGASSGDDSADVEAGRRRRRFKNGSKKRAFARLDLPANSFGLRIARALQNPVLLMCSLGMILLIIIVLSLSGPPEGSSSSTKKSIPSNLKAFTYESSVGFYPNDRKIEWFQSGSDGTYLDSQGDQYFIAHVQKKDPVLLFKRSDIKDANGNQFGFSNFKVSNDQKFLLLETNHQKGWRHSFFADYYIHDIEAKTTTALTKPVTTPPNPEELGSGSVALSMWSPSGHSIAWVRDNNLYVTVDAKTEVQITSDGSPNIINGIADWVYEEEVFGSHHAMWFSPDGTNLAYLKFDDSKVPEHRLQYFLGGQYPHDLLLKYPKPGTPNPIVTLHIANPTATDTTTRDIQVYFDPKHDFGDADRLIVEVTWMSKNDSLLVRTTNRVQDALRLFLVQPIITNANKTSSITWNATLIRDEKPADEGWITLLQPLRIIPPSPAVGRTASSYIELQEDEQGCMQIAYYHQPDDSKPTSWLTKSAVLPSGGCSGEVLGIEGVDADKGIVYYTSSEEGSMQKHVYSVHLDGSSKMKLTPPSGIEWATSLRTWNMTNEVVYTGPGAEKHPEGGGIGNVVGEIGYYDVSFSQKCGYYLLSYRGPDVPFQKLIAVDDDEFKPEFTKNIDVGKKMREYALPRDSYFSVKILSGEDINVHMTVPFDFDPNSDTKYPLLVKVYGGPNSQYVKMTFESSSFESKLAAKGFVVATIDPRGTAAQGRKFRTIVSKNLGKYEAQDVIDVTRSLIERGFIDKSRVAVWGWSFGGFLTSKIIEVGSGVFTLGMAVAPVTDWKFYDSIYTERYMKTPLMNPLGYSSSAVTNMEGFKKVDFLLVHGTGDDNVHFQNTATLVSAFTNHRVTTYRSQFYPDADHSMGFAYSQVFELLAQFMFEKFKIDEAGVRKEKRDFTTVSQGEVVDGLLWSVFPKSTFPES